MFKYALVRYRPSYATDEGRIPLGILAANHEGNSALLICVTSFLIWSDHTPGKSHLIQHVVPTAISIFSHSKSCFGEHILQRIRALTFGVFGISKPQDLVVDGDSLDAAGRKLFDSLVLTNPVYAKSPPEWDIVEFTGMRRRRRTVLETRRHV